MVCIKIELGWFDFGTLLIWVVNVPINNLNGAPFLQENVPQRRYFCRITKTLFIMTDILPSKKGYLVYTKMILNIFLCGLHISLIAKIIIPLIKIPFICPNWSIKTYRVCTPISLNRSDLEPFDNQWASNDEDDDQDVVEKSYLGKHRSISTT